METKAIASKVIHEHGEHGDYCDGCNSYYMEGYEVTLSNSYKVNLCERCGDGLFKDESEGSNDEA